MSWIRVTWSSWRGFTGLACDSSQEEASAELVVQAEPERDPNCKRSAANQKAAHVSSPPASTADASVAPLIYKNSASQATTQTTCAMQQSKLMPEQPSQQLVSQHPPQVTPVHNPPASRHVDAPTAAPTQVSWLVLPAKNRLEYSDVRVPAFVLFAYLH